jgi:hypothetical protein
MFDQLNARSRSHHINIKLVGLNMKLKRKDLPQDERQELENFRNQLISEKNSHFSPLNWNSRSCTRKRRIIDNGKKSTWIPL